MSPISSLFIVLSLGVAMRGLGQLPNLPDDYKLRRGKYLGIYTGFALTKDGYTAKGAIEVSGTAACRVGGVYRGWSFWQFRAGSDSAGVVDNGVSGGNGSRMWVFHGRHRRKIYGSWAFYKNYMHIEPLLLAFIQRYYPQDYAQIKPGTAAEMIQYLAGKAVVLVR